MATRKSKKAKATKKKATKRVCFNTEELVAMNECSAALSQAKALTGYLQRKLTEIYQPLREKYKLPAEIRYDRTTGEIVNE